MQPFDGMKFGRPFLLGNNVSSGPQISQMNRIWIQDISYV